MHVPCQFKKTKLSTINYSKSESIYLTKLHQADLNHASWKTNINNESYKKNDVAKTPINNASKKQYQ
jgi:hypothetical protein